MKAGVTDLGLSTIQNDTKHQNIGQRAQDCGEQSLVFYDSASQRLTDKIVRAVIN